MTTVRVELASLDELFAAPAFDPFAGQVEREPVIERVLRQLEGAPPAGHGILEIVLKAPAIRSSEEVRAAIAAFCDAEGAEALRMAKQVRKRGRQALWIGLPVLGICSALSSVTAAWNDQVAGGLLSNSFIIAGWVAMWRPAELLVYDWRPYSHRARLLHRLAGYEVRLVGG